MYKDLVTMPYSAFDNLTGNGYFIGENGDPSGVHTQSVKHPDPVPVVPTIAKVDSTTNNATNITTPSIVADTKPWWETVLENVTKAVANSTQPQIGSSNTAVDVEKEKTKSLTTILIVVVVLIVSGALMYFAFKKKK